MFGFSTTMFFQDVMLWPSCFTLAIPDPIETRFWAEGVLVFGPVYFPIQTFSSDVVPRTVRE
jgi:hypothetical protein